MKTRCSFTHTRAASAMTIFAVTHRYAVTWPDHKSQHQVFFQPPPTRVALSSPVTQVSITPGARLLIIHQREKASVVYTTHHR